MPARDVALRLVSAVLDDGRSLGDALEDPSIDTPNHADRAFGHMIAATVLRRMGEVDQLIGGFLDRPLPRKAGAIQHVLRLGAAQIAFLDTAKHAAVNCAVEQAKRQRGRFDKLVNAVLRRIEPAQDDAAPNDPAVNVPPWLWQSWCAAYGKTAAADIANAHLSEAPLDLSLRDPAETDRWIQALGGTSLAPGHLRLDRGDKLTTMPGFDDGAWWVQDLAASVPARVLLNGLATPRVARIADLCAAPGGKTAQLAAAGCAVTAVDQDARRVDVLRGNLARLKLAATIETRDVRSMPGDADFDAVLLDAPCTATGTIRRHPDIPRLKRAGDVVAAATLQAELLHAALAMVADDGFLVYAVCSLQAEEGKRQIDALVADRAAERVPIGIDDTAGIAAPDADGDIQTLPSMMSAHGGMDGFYVARIRRTR